MRVHELAKELGVESREVLDSLDVMGYEGRTASSTVPEEAVPRLRAAGGKVKPGSKPRRCRSIGSRRTGVGPCCATPPPG